MTTVYFALQRGPRYELVVGKIKKAFESFGQVKRAFLYDRSKCGIDGYIGKGSLQKKVWNFAYFSKPTHPTRLVRKKNKNNMV